MAKSIGHVHSVGSATAGSATRSRSDATSSARQDAGLQIGQPQPCFAKVGRHAQAGAKGLGASARRPSACNTFPDPSQNSRVVGVVARQVASRIAKAAAYSPMFLRASAWSVSHAGCPGWSRTRMVVWRTADEAAAGHQQPGQIGAGEMMSRRQLQSPFQQGERRDFVAILPFELASRWTAAASAG